MPTNMASAIYMYGDVVKFESAVTLAFIDVST